MVTGFHDDTTTQEVLKEIILTIGMSMEQIQIKCPRKPITHAFLQLKDNVERKNFVRSANILKRGAERTKNKDVSRYGPSNKTRLRQELHSHKTRCSSRSDQNEKVASHVSVDGQIVIKTCTNGYLKYHTYQDIEVEVEKTLEQWMTKNSLQRL